MKRLIVNADDLGLSVPTNLAIERGFRHGMLSSASLMVNMDAVHHAHQHVLRGNPMLGVGLHLCLTSGRPVLAPAEVPLLVDNDGSFCHGFVGLLRLLHSARAAEAQAQIAEEFAAQAHRIDSLGVRIDHIDSHQHVHMIPEIFAVAGPMAQRRGVAIRMSDERIPWTGHTVQRICDAVVRGGLAKKLVLSHFAASIRRCGMTPHCTDHYFGVVHSGRMVLARMLEIVGRLPEGITEINLHPGAGVWSGSPDECSRQDQQFMRDPARAAELNALLSPAFRQELIAQRIELVRFGDVINSQPWLKSA
jgi:chitin disaccharide deacetylase